MVQIHWEFGDYAEAYRSAARRLVAAARSEAEVDALPSAAYLALPTVYLYRHSLELALKDAIIWTPSGSLAVSQPDRVRRPMASCSWPVRL